jgi:hypothetical protein
MTDTSTKELLRGMARELAEGSIVTKALARYIEQLCVSLHKEVVRPLELENARLRAEVEKLEGMLMLRRNDCRDSAPVPRARRAVPNPKDGAPR